MGEDVPASPEPDAGPIARRRFQLRLRSLMMAVVLVAVVLTLARDTFLFWVVLGVLVLPLIGAAVLGLGVAANWIGFGIFAAFDRLVAALRGAGRWPDERAKPKSKSKFDDPWDDFRRPV